MAQIVEVKGNNPYIRSRALADGCHIEHEACVLLIKKYRDDINDVGLSDFKSESFKTGGRPSTEFLLDEMQATFLIMLMKNSRIVVDFQKKLVKEFTRQREIIAQLVAQQKDPSWQNMRADGKAIYFQKTDVIKEFVDYAINQGSKSAKLYYCNFAKMENSALFFFEQKHSNMREVMTLRQLMQVATADQVIDKALKEGMEQELHYRDCYKLAKERIIAFAEIIGQSPILSLTKEQI